jgi:ribosome biogenesis GTPase
LFSSQGRITAVHHKVFLVLTEGREELLPTAGRLPEPPVVGDFVAIENGRISSVLPRRSTIRRTAPGRSRQIQVLAANVDLLFIVTGLDNDFNVRRLERYMVLALDSGATPAFVLTKADLCADIEDKLRAVWSVAGAHAVILSNAHDGVGAGQMRAMITAELTAALIGSSGAGKSTLLNLLLGDERQLVGGVREGDNRGRHTTTHRQMFRIPDGGWLIDQPGLREIQVNADEETVGNAFPEVAELAAQCRFRNCRHEKEPGCAVREQMDPGRLLSFRKLSREAEHAQESVSPVVAAQKKSKVKAVHKAMRKHYLDE